MTITDETLEDRVSVLEDVVFDQISAKMAAMNWGMGQIYANTMANAEEIAGLRVDVAMLETSVHADITALQTAMTMQVNGLRRDMARTAAGLRADLTSFREATSQRFDRVGAQLDSVKDDVSGLKNDMASVKDRVAGMDQRFDTLEALIRDLADGKK